MRLRVLFLAFAVSCTTAASSGTLIGRASPARAKPVAGGHDPVCPLPGRYRGAFELAARETALPLPLLVALARVESRVDQAARSSRGAQGLLQVLPSTAQALGLDASSAQTNGLAAVARAGGAPSGQTITYVANVTEAWRSLRGCT